MHPSVSQDDWGGLQIFNRVPASITEGPSKKQDSPWPRYISALAYPTFTHH